MADSGTDGERPVNKNNVHITVHCFDRLHEVDKSVRGFADVKERLAAGVEVPRDVFVGHVRTIPDNRCIVDQTLAGVFMLIPSDAARYNHTPWTAVTWHPISDDARRVLAVHLDREREAFNPPRVVVDEAKEKTEPVVAPEFVVPRIPLGERNAGDVDWGKVPGFGPDMTGDDVQRVAVLCGVAPATVRAARGRARERIGARDPAPAVDVKPWFHTEGRNAGKVDWSKVDEGLLALDVAAWPTAQAEKVAAFLGCSVEALLQHRVKAKRQRRERDAIATVGGDATGEAKAIDDVGRVDERAADVEAVLGQLSPSAMAVLVRGKAGLFDAWIRPRNMPIPSILDVWGQS